MPSSQHQQLNAHRNSTKIYVTRNKPVPDIPTQVQRELGTELQTSPTTTTASSTTHPSFATSSLHVKSPVGVRQYAPSPTTIAPTPSSFNFPSTPVNLQLQDPQKRNVQQPTSILQNSATNNAVRVATNTVPAPSQFAVPANIVPNALNVHQPSNNMFHMAPSTNTLTVEQFETVRRHATTQSHDPRAQLELACRLCEAADHLAHRYTDPTHPSSRDVDQAQQAANRAAWTAQSLAIAKKLSHKIEFADAQFFMGSILSSGAYGIEANNQRALEYYLRAAKQDHSDACYRVAVCEEMGIGTIPNTDRAIQYYKRAALLGSVDAMYKLAIFALNPDQITTNDGQQKLSTLNNDSSATLNDQNDKKSGRDFDAGLNWLEKAAAKADVRHPHALYELGLLYEHAPTSYFKAGDPIPLKMDKALEMHTAAASFGYAPAQSRLGRALEFGELGCDINPVASLEYYYAAANQGDSDAELSMAGWCWTGGPSLPKNDSEALQWAERSAQRGNARALYCLGYFCEIGVGQEVDTERAIRCYEMAAQRGHQRAMQKMAAYEANKPKPKNAYPIRAPMKRPVRT